MTGEASFCEELLTMTMQVTTGSDAAEGSPDTHEKEGGDPNKHLICSKG
ncbi:hypothetical protein HMPREF9622_00649 [Cutibacterium modestum HL037PA3]|jgi:hypothetical protein|nr:hypothetical protein HMPREF9621_01061 [Cutibacterium modestum HL037PA2]EFS93746.1 hypothetical protein HMPREF9607_00204 [Cutibacterium modestum HL044PA1]EFT16440.1 hypothetical protein HMPREF9622_00649 [Cutibacterium modestum HL037PA3]EGG27534.1 hypothetical protein PA08_0804 [Cutibacterium modestum P08]